MVHSTKTVVSLLKTKHSPKLLLYSFLHLYSIAFYLLRSHELFSNDLHRRCSVWSRYGIIGNSHSNSDTPTDLANMLPMTTVVFRVKLDPDPLTPTDSSPATSTTPDLSAFLPPRQLGKSDVLDQGRPVYGCYQVSGSMELSCLPSYYNFFK